MFPMTACDLSVKVQQKHIIGPINLTINEGGITVLMGPNGAGKTTLLKALHGIIRLANGQVTFATPAKTAQEQQSFVFQSPIMLRRSVLENLAYPLMINGQDKQSAMERARTWATKIGLSAHMDRPAPFLSGGEKQKIALARALITSPKLLFLDEPSASLDGAATVEIEAVRLHQFHLFQIEYTILTNETHQQLVFDHKKGQLILLFCSCLLQQLTSKFANHMIKL